MIRRMLVLLGAGAVTFGQKADQPKADPNETFTDWGRVSRKVIEPSDKGVWDGTWMYVNRDSRLVMWIKTEDGVPQVKFQYRSTSSSEGFITDWNGNASYEMSTAQGHFSLNIEKRDANAIEGRWDWRLEGTNSFRVEQGDYRMYRTGDGRFFVLDFSDYQKSLSGRKGERLFETHPAWTFQKVSKRLVLWDELPF
jgi:hypothetical protein